MPDAELYGRRYVERLDGLTEERFPHDEVDGIHGIRTPAMSVNRIFTMWGHRFIYDYETLAKLLDYHGFVDVTRESFRSGRDPVLLNDDEFHVAESLYVEARRAA